MIICTILISLLYQKDIIIIHGSIFLEIQVVKYYSQHNDTMISQCSQYYLTLYKKYVEDYRDIINLHLRNNWNSNILDNTYKISFPNMMRNNNDK